METYLLKICLAAGVASASAIGVVGIDRFRNTPAGAAALGAAFLPWCMMAVLFHGSNFPTLLCGLSVGVSLFLFVMIFYSHDTPGMRRTLAVTLAGLGTGASLCFGAFVIYPFLVTG